MGRGVGRVLGNPPKFFVELFCTAEGGMARLLLAGAGFTGGPIGLLPWFVGSAPLEWSVL